MFYTYALSSLQRGYIYVGITSDLERRLKEHNSSKNKTRLEARTYEKKLKSGFGKEFLKTLIQDRDIENTED